jgi:hypothetical protein
MIELVFNTVKILLAEMQFQMSFYKFWVSQKWNAKNHENSYFAPTELLS